ncbi:hypothetical protein TNCV_508551 [Trichonephila clavipes]|nr:hypothetical protein TNCV_508551 [Trichonephila clavipes]
MFVAANARENLELLKKDSHDELQRELTTCCCHTTSEKTAKTATDDSDVVQSGRPIFDDFFQHLWPYIGNNTANVVFQIFKRLWLIRIDQ